MTNERLGRDEFYRKLAGLDEADLRKALWTLYWRGPAPLRERVEAVIDPQAKAAGDLRRQAAPEPEQVLAEVTEFVSFARSGAYLARDRRVSPKERSRWRHTFRRLAREAQDALRSEDVEPAADALAAMIDLACDTQQWDFFRSEDPVEAARFVVSDAAAMLWSRVRQARGFTRFAESAAGQLAAWESPYGWTRHGEGWVPARETSLAHVVAELLVVPDLWAEFAGHYLRALERSASAGGRGRRGEPRQRPIRAENLREWHGSLIERLTGSADEELLDRLVTHPALPAAERLFLQARLAAERGGHEAPGS